MQIVSRYITERVSTLTPGNVPLLTITYLLCRTYLLPDIILSPIHTPFSQATLSTHPLLFYTVSPSHTLVLKALVKEQITGYNVKWIYIKLYLLDFFC